jgi:flagellar hook-length control protein FliK
LNFGGETPGGRKAGEHLPKEQRHDPQALASVAALNAPSSELHQSAEAKSTVGPASVLHKVAGEIAKSVQGKRHEAIMTLDPPELGSLKIGLVVEGDKIRVRILAETRDARELIEHHLGELKQALQIQQFDSVDVLIESGRFDSAGDPRQGFQQPSQDRRRPEINSVRFFESKDVPAEFRQVSRTRMDSDRVSMWA